MTINNIMFIEMKFNIIIINTKTRFECLISKKLIKNFIKKSCFDKYNVQSLFFLFCFKQVSFLLKYSYQIRSFRRYRILDN